MKNFLDFRFILILFLCICMFFLYREIESLNKKTNSIEKKIKEIIDFKPNHNKKIENYNNQEKLNKNIRYDREDLDMEYDNNLNFELIANLNLQENNNQHIDLNESDNEQPMNLNESDNEQHLDLNESDSEQHVVLNESDSEQHVDLNNSCHEQQVDLNESDHEQEINKQNLDLNESDHVQEINEPKLNDTNNIQEINEPHLNIKDYNIIENSENETIEEFSNEPSDDINIYSNDNEEETHSSVLESYLENVNITVEDLTKKKLIELQEIATENDISLVNNLGKRKTKLLLAKDIISKKNI